MKKFNNIKYLLGILIPIIVFTGCKDDFLERPPLDTIVDANFFKNDEQLRASTALLYNQVWFDYNGRASYNLGDFRGGTAFSAYNDIGSVQFNTTGDNSYNGDAWRSFFIVVGQSNLLMENIKKYAGAEVTENAKKIAIAEARFMRGTVYRYIASNWGDVPIIENNLAIISNPLVKKNTNQSVWKFLTKDLLAAAQDLPETPFQVGRVTKWSAEAMLARVYLTRSGVESQGGVRKQEFLDSAKYYAKRVITLSNAKLLGNYEDLFKLPYDNNSESLFELQWVYTNATDWGTQNTQPADLAYSNSIGNGGDGWGGDKSATYWMLSQYDGLMTNGYTADKRLKATYMLPGATYPEVLQDVDGELKGLVFPNSSGDVNFASIKKYVTGKATSQFPASAQRYGHDTYMMRLAEMYLTYAEAELGNNAETSDATALEYFNAVHERAGLPKYTAPLTLDVILNERFKEFAMEGMAWYDLVSLHYWKPEMAYSIISNQDRGKFAVKPDQFPNPTKWTITPTSWDQNRKFPANSGNFLLPIPTAEITGAPNLAEDPVDYYSGE